MATSGVVEHDLLTPREVCELLRVAPATLRLPAWDDLLKPVKFPSGHRRYRRTVVEAVMSGEAAS